MNIERINTYHDSRFSQIALNQHGCFLADGEPYEIDIFSDHEAVIRGREAYVYPEVIEVFRFYTPHITSFYDEKKALIQQYPNAKLLTLSLRDIQPSQFFVDKDKVAAVSNFLTCGKDIIIQVIKQRNRYISLDGHTRLYYAVTMGWEVIRAVEVESDDWVYGFVEAAQQRKVFSPYDLPMISHEEYEIKWNKFCDDFFAG